MKRMAVNPGDLLFSRQHGSATATAKKQAGALPLAQPLATNLQVSTGNTLAMASKTGPGADEIARRIVNDLATVKIKRVPKLDGDCPPLNNESQFKYAGNLIIDSDDRRVNVEYDPNNEQLRVRFDGRGSGAVSTYIYDAMRRVVRGRDDFGEIRVEVMRPKEPNKSKWGDKNIRNSDETISERFSTWMYTDEIDAYINVPKGFSQLEVVLKPRSGALKI